MLTTCSLWQTQHPQAGNVVFSKRIIESDAGYEFEGDDTVPPQKDIRLLLASCKIPRDLLLPPGSSAHTQRYKWFQEFKGYNSLARS
jgi:hypothetical protein